MHLHFDGRPLNSRFGEWAMYYYYYYCYHHHHSFVIRVTLYRWWLSGALGGYMLAEATNEMQIVWQLKVSLLDFAAKLAEESTSVIMVVVMMTTTLLSIIVTKKRSNNNSNGRRKEENNKTFIVRHKAIAAFKILYPNMPSPVIYGWSLFPILFRIYLFHFL